MTDDLSFDLTAPVETMFRNNTLDMPTTTDAGIDLTGGFASEKALYYVEPYRGYYWPWYEPYREYHTHIHKEGFSDSEKFEKSFKIARKLIDEKVVTAKYQKTIGDFFKLMDIIVKVL